MAMTYNDPANGIESTIGDQLVKAFFNRKALEEADPDMYFTQLASVEMMPKNSGKAIERYIHIPLLDDRNVNDQGIDAQGKTISNGNLYGSSKDIGTISARMPVIDEKGGRVNRVGFKRKHIKGTMQNFGYFTEYTQESVDFDTENDLDQWIHTQMVKTATKITEDLIQIDLLNAAGVVLYAGTALKDGDIDATSKVTFEDLARLSVALDNNRTPKKTTVIKGSTNTDTRVIPSARVMFIGSDMIQTLRKLKDYHGNPAFIPIEQYAAAGTVLRGEIGTIDQFRIVVVPEMFKWAGAGKAVDSSTTIHSTNGKADIYPMLCVGDDSFTTIGFQPTGTNTKFNIIDKKPGVAQANTQDPYGKRGFMSIQWWYGFMVYRPERIALVKTAVDL